MLPGKPLPQAYIPLLTLVVVGAVVALNGLIYPFKYIAVRLLDAGQGVSSLPLALLAHLGITGVMVLGLLGAGLTMLTVVEIRHQYLSRSLQSANRNSWIVLMLLVLLFAHCYLEPGLLVVGDANAHVSRVAHFANAIREGAYPGWSNYFYGGTPVFEFTGPLFHLLAGGISLSGLDPDVASRLVLTITVLVAAGGFLMLTQTLGIERWAGALGALIYASSFAHNHLVLFRGEFPQAIVLMLLPLLVLSSWQILRSPRVKLRWHMLLVVCVFASFANHQTSAVYMALTTSVFLLGGLVSAQLHWNRLLALTASAATGVLLSVPLIVPVLLENQWLVMGDAPTGIFFRLPAMNELTALLTFRAALSGSQSSAYISYLAYLAGLFALLALILDRARSVSSPLVLTSVGLLLFVLFVDMGYVREITFLSFAVSLLATLGLAQMRQRFPRLQTPLLLLLILELLAASIYPLARNDKGHFFQLAEVTQELFPNSRVIIVSGSARDDLRISTGPNGGIIARRDVPLLTGPHNITVPQTHNFQVALLKRLEGELRDSGEISPQTRNLLCLGNVAVVAFPDANKDELLTQLAQLRSLTETVPAITLDCATPVAFAPELTQQTQEPRLKLGALWGDGWRKQERFERLFERQDDFLNLVQLPDQAVLPATDLASIPVTELPENYRPGSGRGNLEIVEYKLSRDMVRLTIHSQSDGFLRLAHPWYPFLEVRINDRAANTVPGISGEMVLAVAAGTSRIQITAGPSPLRLNSLWFAGGVLILWLIWLVVNGRRKPVSDSAPDTP